MGAGIAGFGLIALLWPGAALTTILPWPIPCPAAREVGADAVTVHLSDCRGS